MDLVAMATKLISAQIILGIFGLTYVVQIIIKQRLKRIPDELILVPWFLGFLAGYMQYFGDTNIHADANVTFSMHIMRASMLSMMYAGGAVILYKSKQLVQKYLPAAKAGGAGQ